MSEKRQHRLMTAIDFPHEVELQGLLPSRVGAGRSIRRAFFHLRENDRHLLPTDLPGTTAQTRELFFRTNSGRQRVFDRACVAGLKVHRIWMSEATIEIPKQKGENGMRLRLEKISSPLSEILVVTDEDGLLRALEFADLELRLHRLLKMHYGDFVLTENAVPWSLVKQIEDYFHGELEALDSIQTATGGTEFQREVWKALREISPGKTATYGTLAERVGRPGSARAVGAANGSNPIPIVVPCHRVIGANGTLTGFAGGLPRKKWLIDHESRFAKTSLFSDRFETAHKGVVC